MTGDTLTIPAHVAPESVVDFDLWSGPEIREDPYLGMAHLHDGPKIFYTPRNGGHWGVTSAKYAREVMEDHLRFPVDLHFNPMRDEHGARLIPAQVDPPVHTRYRAIINPPMSPASVAKLSETIRALSRDLIEGVRDKGRCDFFREIAQNFPIAIFMGMADLPFEDRFKLFAMVDLITHDSTPGAAGEGLRQMSEYLRGTILERRERPGDDVLSIIATAKIDGEYPPENDVIYLATNLVLGGLDTVISGLTYGMGYLARNPEQYRLLVEAPGRIRRAVEELLRVYGPAALERCVREDMEFHGTRLARFDRIVIIPALYNTDPDAIEDPLRVDFDRSRQPSMTFGAGPHHCVGAHLARLEMRIFLEEWVKAIPQFSLQDGTKLQGIGGFVLQLTSLPLAWDSGITHQERTEQPS